MERMTTKPKQKLQFWIHYVDTTWKDLYTLKMIKPVIPHTEQPNNKNVYKRHEPALRTTRTIHLEIGDTVEVDGEASPRLLYLGTIGDTTNPDLKFREMSPEGRIYVCSKHQAESLTSSVARHCYETHCLSSGEEGHSRRLYLDRGMDLSNMVQVLDPCLLSSVSRLTPARVHKQMGSTCYAHACAMVIHHAESRIVGRNPNSCESLTEEIIAKHGTDGCNPKTVLNEWCVKRRLRFSTTLSHNHVLKAIQSGRPVVASFFLTDLNWKIFSQFFQTNPEGVLAKHAVDWTEDFTRTCQIKGHAVVITGGFLKTNGTIEYRIKNSWGTAFGNKGFFSLESDALPSGFDQFYDVYYLVEDLSYFDVAHYILWCLLKAEGNLVFSEKVKDRIVVAKGDNSAYLLIDATSNCYFYRIVDIAKVKNELSNAETVHVLAGGVIVVSGASFKFKVFEIPRYIFP